jgi:hypothetical protein
MHFYLMVTVDGGHYPVELSWWRITQPDPVRVPAGKAAKVDITFTNPGPGSAANVWFALAPFTTQFSDDVQRGIPLGEPFWVKYKVSVMPPGTTTFSISVPAADLQSGSLAPVIVMGAQEGHHQVAYAFMQIVPVS